MTRKVEIYFLLLFLFSSKALAEEYSFTAIEAMSLPPFCRGLSIGNFQDDAKHLKTNQKIPGEHTQHFCHGMKSIQRQDYPAAINEFDYVEGKSTDKNILLTFVVLYKGYALENLGKVKEALIYYDRAISLNPKNTEAYIKRANFFSHLGRKKEAIETIEKGLEVNPNSKSLRKKLHKLQSPKKETEKLKK